MLQKYQRDQIEIWGPALKVLLLINQIENLTEIFTSK